MAQAISNLPIGARVKIPVNGVDTIFIVVNHGTPQNRTSDYSNCNGTWLMAETLYGGVQKWHSSYTSVRFTQSAIKTYLNSTFYSLLDATVQASILSAKLPITYGYTSVSGPNSSATPVFLLSRGEVMLSGICTLEYFKGQNDNLEDGDDHPLLVAKDANGTAQIWWLRDAEAIDWDDGEDYGTDLIAYSIYKSGRLWSGSVSGTSYVRPCFILNSSFTVSDTCDDDVCYTIGDGGSASSRFYTGGTNGVAQAVKKLYVGDENGLARPVKKLYAGVPNFIKRTLPSEYTQVEYIQSSGTQYINTGFKPNQDTRVVMEVYNDAAATEFLFGARNAQSRPEYTYGFAVISNTSVRYDYASVETSLTVSGAEGRLFVDANKNACTYNSGSINPAASTFSVNYPLFLLAMNTAGSAVSAPASAKLYSCKIYDNGTLVRDYVPCKNSAGTVGLYDIVNEVFHRDGAGGTFVAGDTYKSVARLVYSAREPNTLSYQGTVTALSAIRRGHAGASNPKYALFAGGYDNISSVDAYSTSLIRSTAPALSQGRQDIGAASIGDYAIFAGGNRTNNNPSSYVDAYDSSLTKTQKYLSLNRGYVRGASVGNYAIFSGGYYDDDEEWGPVETTDAFDKSLTRSTLSGGYARYEHGSVSNGNYAIFGGGRDNNYVYANVWYWNASLTRSTTSLFVSVGEPAGVRAGDYALFVAGDDADNLSPSYNDNIVNIFSSSMTRSVTFLRRTNYGSFDGTASLGKYGIAWGGYQVDGWLHAFDDKLTYLSKDMSGISKVQMNAAATIGDYALFSGGAGYENGSTTHKYTNTVHAFKLI